MHFMQSVMTAPSSSRFVMTPAGHTPMPGMVRWFHSPPNCITNRAQACSAGMLICSSIQGYITYIMGEIYKLRENGA